MRRGDHLGTTDHNSQNQRAGRSGAAPGWPPLLTTHRSAYSHPLAVLGWLGVGASLGPLLLVGETSDGVDAAPWHFLASWLIYCSLWRPCVRTLTDGYALVNPLRTHRIPYSAVYDVRVRYAVAIRAEGRRFGGWSAPTRPGKEAIVKAWQDGRASALPGPATGVVSAWNRPAIISGAVAGLWAVGTILV